MSEWSCSYRPNGKGVVAWMRGNSAARRDFLFAKLALSTLDR